VLDAEEAARPRNPGRVWVFPIEIPEGNWGSRGNIQRLADIMGFITGDAERAKTHAAARLAATRSR